MAPIQPAPLPEPSGKAPIEDANVRRAWDAVQVVSLKTAAERLRITLFSIKHRRDMADHGRFPLPVAIEGAGKRFAAFSMLEIDLWASTSPYWDLRKTPEVRTKVGTFTQAELLRAAVESNIEVAQPIVVAAAEQRLGVKTGRLRSSRQLRESNRFPYPLEWGAVKETNGRLHPDSSLFSWVELMLWWNWMIDHNAETARRMLNQGEELTRFKVASSKPAAIPAF